MPSRTRFRRIIDRIKLPIQNPETRLYSISGHVLNESLGLSSVNVTFGEHSTTTQEDGSYTIVSLPVGSNGDVTFSLAGYTFDPSSITITNLSEDTVLQDVTATVDALVYDLFGGSGAFYGRVPDTISPTGKSWLVQKGAISNIADGRTRVSSGPGAGVIDCGVKNVTIQSNIEIVQDKSASVAFRGSGIGSGLPGSTDYFLAETLLLASPVRNSVRVIKGTTIATPLAPANVSPPLVAGQTRLLTAHVYENLVRILVDGVYHTEYYSLDLSGTYHGIGGTQDAGGWNNDVKITPLTMKRITFLGDSIAENGAGYSRLVPRYHNSNKGYGIFRGVSSTSILNHLAGQVLAAASDNADIIILEHGTNDNNAGDMAVIQAIVEQAIVDLKESNPNATLYYMNVLPRWTDVTGAVPVDKSNIRAAISNACAAQSITCWDTINWIAASDTVDGLHPSWEYINSGHNKITDRILERI